MIINIDFCLNYILKPQNFILFMTEDSYASIKKKKKHLNFIFRAFLKGILLWKEVLLGKRKGVRQEVSALVTIQSVIGLMSYEMRRLPLWDMEHEIWNSLCIWKRCPCAIIGGCVIDIILLNSINRFTPELNFSSLGSVSHSIGPSLYSVEMPWVWVT